MSALRTMDIEIRPIQTHAEYRAVEELQRAVWRLDAAETVPTHLLLTAHKNGGLLLGAFARSPAGSGEQLVGFVFGFLGASQPAPGRLKHCSHMAGVHPDYRDQNLGYRLKLAQRQHVLAQGIDLITWTFDPLESRNAHLNFHKLGAVSRTYLPNLYGDMRDGLNASLPSDRLQVEWPIASQRVARRLHGESQPAGAALAELRAAGVAALNEPLAGGGDLLRPSPVLAPDSLPARPAGVLLCVPRTFQAIKAADMSLAAAWRLHTRALFEAAFAGGYVATDFLLEGDRGYYLLEMAAYDQLSKPHEDRTP